MVTVIAMYDEFDDAREVIEDLDEAGFDRANIGLVARDADERYSAYTDADGDVEADEGAGFGAVVGTLIGLGSVLLPGVGTVIGGGTLGAAALAAGIGAAAGAATGGVTAALIDLGVPEEEAHIYAEGVRRGGAIVTVNATTEQERNRAVDIMEDEDPVDLHQRGEYYRRSGWERFDEKAEAWDRDRINQDRDYWDDQVEELPMGTDLDNTGGMYGGTGARFYDPTDPLSGPR